MTLVSSRADQVCSFVSTPCLRLKRGWYWTASTFDFQTDPRFYHLAYDAVCSMYRTGGSERYLDQDRTRIARPAGCWHDCCRSTPLGHATARPRLLIPPPFTEPSRQSGQYSRGDGEQPLDRRTVNKVTLATARSASALISSATSHIRFLGNRQSSERE